MNTTHTFKEGDFYNCWYTDEYRKNHPNTDLNHCFEGLVRVVISDEGVIQFWDTFWGLSPRYDVGHWFDLSDIGDKIELSYLANINELEKGHPDDIKYYDAGDLVEFHDQHRCHKTCVYNYRRIGAKRSKQKIKDSLESKIDSITHNMDNLVREKDRLQSLLDSIDSPDTLHNIWI